MWRLFEKKKPAPPPKKKKGGSRVVTPGRPGYIPLADAARYSGMAHDRMKRRVQNKKVVGYRDPLSNRWYVEAASLAAYCRAIGVTVPEALAATVPR